MGDVLEMERFTICTECKHLKSVDGGLIWYNQYCRASERPTKRDPFDGLVKYVGTNDLGGEYFTDDKFDYCRINDGNCSEFQPAN